MVRTKEARLGPALRPGAAALALSAAALSATACSSLGRALGSSKVAPDEFRVVAKAPLVVPPDYALRPPAPGEPRPQELQPENQARAALLGQEAAATRSEGETLLASRAGAKTANPLIRYQMDDEFGAIAHKDKSFADQVMFWRKGQPQVATPVSNDANTSTPVDPAVEQARLAALTGDKPVIIRREPARSGVKLPGL